jgi:pilus assembly protein Flp/PilA
MKRLRFAFASLLEDETGQDLVEYALVVALIALGSVAALKSLTNSISDVFQTVGSSLTSSVA